MDRPALLRRSGRLFSISSYYQPPRARVPGAKGELSTDAPGHQMRTGPARVTAAPAERGESRRLLVAQHAANDGSGRARILTGAAAPCDVLVWPHQQTATAIDFGEVALVRL
jgi:hypothetical protein